MEKTDQAVSPPAADNRPKNDEVAPPRNVEAVAGAVLPASTAPKSPAPFGGHRGGKPTISGYPVDSAEHAEFMRKREAERSARRRAEARSKMEAPALPARPVAPAGAVPPVLPKSVGPSPAPSPDGPAVPAVALAAAPAVGLVAWSSRMLQKPAALALRIVDRFRKIQLHRRIDRLGLTPSEAAEVKRDLEWQEAARTDFENALAEVTALSLNKSGVSAEYAPYVNLCLAGGELALSHFAALDRLEKMYALKLEALKSANPEDVTLNKVRDLSERGRRP